MSRVQELAGVPIAPLCFHEVLATVLDWAKTHQSRYVCFSPADHIVRAQDSPAFRQALRSADLSVPDGVPVVWTLKGLGARSATRVYGPDFMCAALAAAAREELSVGLYGGAPETLRRLETVLRSRFGNLRIAFSWTPPFRPLTVEEDREIVRAMNASGAALLFVGLGTPKQELWMAAHRGLVHAVMLGVGAAFDFLAGTKPQAPRWMMRSGLEWVFRLATEPRRLWRRYLVNNPRFLLLAAKSLLRRHTGPDRAGQTGHFPTA